MYINIAGRRDPGEPRRAPDPDDVPGAVGVLAGKGTYMPEGSWLLSTFVPSFFQVFSLEGGFEEYRSIVEKELVL